MSMPYEKLLSSGEVAAYFHVHPKTVARWAKKGQIKYIRTAGGHRRYPASELRRIALLGALSDADSIQSGESVAEQQQAI